MTRDDSADPAYAWRLAFGDLVDRKQLQHGLSDGKLIRDAKLVAGELGRYKNGERGSPRSDKVLSLIKVLEITPEDLAALPPYDGRARVTVPVRVSEIAEVRTEVSAQTSLLLEIKASILAMQAPNPEADLAEARKAFDRTANAALSPDTRARLEQALNERRDGDALQIIAEQRAARAARMDDMRGEWQALNREGFAERMIEAGLQTRARKWTEAIATYSAALRQPEGVEPADLDRARVSRLRHVNFLAHREKTKEKAEEILFAPYDPPLGPNVFGYTILINKAGNPVEARHWYDAMVAAGVVPNVITYSSLIAGAGSREEARHWYDAMVAAGVVPNLLTLTAMISKCGREVDAAPYYLEIKRLGLKPDRELYTSMIHLCDSFGAAYVYFAEMMRAKVMPDAFVLQVMIRKAKEFRTARDLLAGMRRLGMKPDLIAYSGVMVLAPGLSEQHEIAGWMMADGVRVNGRFLDLLRRKGRQELADEFAGRGLVLP